MAERTKSWDEPRRVRAWYGGKEPATSEVIEAAEAAEGGGEVLYDSLEGSCLLYTSPSPRDATLSRMPSSA